MKRMMIALIIIISLLLFGGVQFLRNEATKISEVKPVKGVEELYYARNLMVDMFGAKIGNEVVLIGAGIDTTGAALDSFLAGFDSSRDQVKTIIVSHGHPDHIGGIPHLPDARVYIGEQDVDLMEGRVPNRTFVQDVLTTIFPVATPTATDPLNEAREIPVGNEGETIYAIPFPGHTPGSSVYLFRGALFVGDVFEYKAGKLVLPTPDSAVDNDAMLDSIIALPELLKGRDLTVFCPGHGDGGCTPPEKTRQLFDDLLAQARAKRNS